MEIHFEDFKVNKNDWNYDDEEKRSKFQLKTSSASERDGILKWKKKFNSRMEWRANMKVT